MGAMPQSKPIREWPYQMTYRGIGKIASNPLFIFPCLSDARQSVSEYEIIPVRKVKMDSTDWCCRNPSQIKGPVLTGHGCIDKAG